MELEQEIWQVDQDTWHVVREENLNNWLLFFLLSFNIDLLLNCELLRTTVHCNVLWNTNWIFSPKIGEILRFCEKVAKARTLDQHDGRKHSRCKWATPLTTKPDMLYDFWGRKNQAIQFATSKD